MLKRAAMCLVVMALVFPFLSCTRIDARKSVEEGGVMIERLTDQASIPSKWGNLVNVSYRAEMDVFSLWFQDKDGNIRMATLSPRGNQLWGVVLLIPQK